MRRIARPVVLLGVAGCCCAVGYALSDKRRRDAAARTAWGLRRLSRVVSFGIAATLRDVHLKALSLPEGSAEQAEVQREVHLKNAKAFLGLCLANGTGYLKLAQYLSTLQHLPVEWTSTLAKAQDHAHPVSFSSISSVFVDDTGLRPEEVFTSIEEEPCAAASIAQVHRAVTRDGQAVAVKIQYPHMQETFLQDLTVLKLMLSFVEWYWPDYGYTWLLPEFEKQSLCEIDFLQEINNAERTAAMFADNPRVHVPRVYKDMSSRRVIVMEFIQGCKVNDHAGLRNLRVDERALAKTITAVFAQMALVHGFVHCDPHPGNLFVRAAPGRPRDYQLVLLDHGMYRRLDYGFRRGYCELWHALIIGDIAAGEAAAVALGMPREDFGHIALLLTFQPAGGRVGQKLSAEDRAKLRAKYKGFTQRDLNDALQRLPRDLLFLNRSTSLVRSLNLELGGTARERFVTTAEAAVLGLQLTRDLQAAGLYEPVRVSSGGAGAEVEAALAEAVEALVAAGPLDPGDSSSSGGGGGSLLQRMLGAVGAGRAPAAARVPLTYAAVEAAGLIKATPTESELLRAAWSGSGGASGGGAALWLSALQRGWGLVSLHWRLQAMSIAAAAVSAGQGAASSVRWGLEALRLLPPQPAPMLDSAADTDGDAASAERERKRGGRRELKDPG